MPGIPCVYYGSEWGAEGNKNDGDPSLRLSYDTPIENELFDWISKLAAAHKSSKALLYGDYGHPVLTNRQCIFRRCCDGETVLVAINADEQSYYAGCDIHAAAEDLLTGRELSIDGGLELPPYSAMYLRLK